MLNHYLQNDKKQKFKGGKVINRKRLFFILIFLIGTIVATCGQKSENKTDQQDDKKKEINYLVTFVELGSVRCIPCKKMQPIMKEIEEKYGDQVKVVFHDVWTGEGKPFAYKYKIRLIPTQVFLDKDGEEYFRHEGFFPKDELIEVLKQKGVK